MDLEKFHLSKDFIEMIISELIDSSNDLSKTWFDG